MTKTRKSNPGVLILFIGVVLLFIGFILNGFSLRRLGYNGVKKETISYDKIYSNIIINDFNTSINVNGNDYIEEIKIDYENGDGSEYVFKEAGDTLEITRLSLPEESKITENEIESLSIDLPTWYDGCITINSDNGYIYVSSIYLNNLLVRSTNGTFYAYDVFADNMIDTENSGGYLAYYGAQANSMRAVNTDGELGMVLCYTSDSFEIDCENCPADLASIIVSEEFTVNAESSDITADSLTISDFKLSLKDCNAEISIDGKRDDYRVETKLINGQCNLSPDTEETADNNLYFDIVDGKVEIEFNSEPFS